MITTKRENKMSNTNIQTEAIILSRIIDNKDVINEVMGNLHLEHFTLPFHRDFFIAAEDLFKKGRKVDCTALFHGMRENKSEFANINEILELSRYQTSDEVLPYIEDLKNLHLKRRMQLSLSIHAANLAKEGSNPFEIYSNVMSECESAINQNSEFKDLSLSESYNKDYRESGKNFIEFLEHKRDLYARGIRGYDGYESGYSCLDKYLNGFNQGHYIIIGARPGVGKTTFLLNLMIRFAVNKNLPIGYFSLEATREEAMLNATCILAGIESQKAKWGSTTQKEHATVVDAEEILQKTKVYIDDQSNLSLSQVVARTRRWITTYGIKILFIDYLTLIRGDGKFGTKQEEVQQVSQGLRSLAKTYKIPIICVAQLNRDSEKTGKPPTKADLRESGQIEMDAHSILMLHRPETKIEFREHSKPSNLDIHIVKNRYGEEAKIEFAFEKSTGRLYEKLLREETRPPHYYDE